MFVCVPPSSSSSSSPPPNLPNPLPVFKEIISWRQDCERAELWARQQADRIGITELRVNNPGVVGTAAAGVYYCDLCTCATADASQSHTCTEDESRGGFIWVRLPSGLTTVSGPVSDTLVRNYIRLCETGLNFIDPKFGNGTVTAHHKSRNKLCSGYR